VKNRLPTANLPACCDREVIILSEKIHARKKIGHKKFQSQFFSGQKILIAKKIPLKNFQSQKFPAKKISRSKIFKKFSRGPKKTLEIFFSRPKNSGREKFLAQKV